MRFFRVERNPENDAGSGVDVVPWDSFDLKKDLIGEPLKSGDGFYQRESRFITLPENDVYESGYGFYMSSKLVNDREGHISLPDDYKIDLQMSPAAREQGKRYKRFKLTGREIKEAVFFPDAKRREEAEEAKRKEHDRRNSRVIGRIVYGCYQGNRYGDLPDYRPDYFFFNGNRYYNQKHEKVLNVEEVFTVMDGVSKYFFERMVDTIKERLAAYLCIRECIEKLRKIDGPDEKTVSIIFSLQAENDEIMETLRSDLQKKEVL